ncbi:MAG: hypothetical protein AB3X44_11970 [Leptothrix sp. (in: b-proteobacteria)]
MATDAAATDVEAMSPGCPSSATRFAGGLPATRPLGMAAAIAGGGSALLSAVVPDAGLLISQLATEQA